VDSVTTSMNAFTQVPRFETLLMFLSEREKDTVRSVLQKIGNVDSKWESVIKQ